MDFQLLDGMLVLGNCLPLQHTLVVLVLEKLTGGILDLVIGFQWMIVLFPPGEWDYPRFLYGTGTGTTSTLGYENKCATHELFQ